MCWQPGGCILRRKEGEVELLLLSLCRCQGSNAQTAGINSAETERLHEKLLYQRRSSKKRGL